MKEYWEAPLEEIEEEEFPESGRPGCIAVFAVLLALLGIGYSAVFGIVGVNLVLDQPDRAATGALLTLCAVVGLPIPVTIAVGLWRMRMWAWWLAVILQSLGLGLGVLSFAAALLGADPARALGFVLGPLMGLLTGVVILTWFLRNRDRFRPDEADDVSGRVEEAAGADNPLLIFAATAIGCTALLCLLGAVLLAAFYVLGVTPTGILRTLVLPVP